MNSPTEAATAVLISRTRGFSFIYVAPHIRDTLPSEYQKTPTFLDDAHTLWQRIDSNLRPLRTGTTRRTSKLVRAPSSAGVLLEWPKRTGEQERRCLPFASRFPWWLVGGIPIPPRLVRVWASDIAEMLWLLGWPSAGNFLEHPLGRDIASGDLAMLHPHADRLQELGHPLGMALARWANGMGDRIAVALDVYQLAAGIRAEWAISGTVSALAQRWSGADGSVRSRG